MPKITLNINYTRSNAVFCRLFGHHCSLWFHCHCQCGHHVICAL